MPSSTEPSSPHVVVFASNPAVREQVRLAVGSRPDPDLGRLRWTEVSTGDELVAAVDAGDVDLCVLDGEAQPVGGMALSRQLKNEIRDCPAMVLLLARADDRWLATWSQADATETHPVDPGSLTTTVVQLLTDGAHAPGTRSTVP